MEYIVKTKGLTKSYGKRNVVDGVDLQIGKGQIYGLIGPNGAGKTTLMRLLLGLARPKSGHMELLGSKALSAARKKIGALIEAPALDKNESAYENLKRFAILTDSTEEEIQKLLTLVGLQYTGKKKAGQFSLGMRQRLGIAIALLGSPELLILDEPINGLDPEGIISVRNVILELSRQGITVLISSHLLDELGKIATAFGIMVGGKLVEQLSADEAHSRCRTWLKLLTTDGQKARQLIAAWKPELQVEVMGNEIHVFSKSLNSAQLNRLLLEGGVDVYELKHEQVSLEQYFVERMGLRYV